MNMKQKKVGLVLGGSGSRCFAQLAIVDELIEKGIEISHISGTSAGAMIGVLIAAGIPSKEIKKELYSRRTRLEWYLPYPSKEGFMSQRVIARIIRKFLGKRQLEDLKIPVTIVATDLKTGQDYYFETGDPVVAVKAATAYPGLFKPIKIKDHILCDGGITNCFPADITREKVGKTGVVITLLTYGPFDQNNSAMSNSVKILFRSIFIPLEKQRRIHAEKYSDIVLRPLYNSNYAYSIKNVGVSMLSFSNKSALEKVYQIGRKYAKENIDMILKEIKK